MTSRSLYLWHFWHFHDPPGGICLPLWQIGDGISLLGATTGIARASREKGKNIALSYLDITMILSRIMLVFLVVFCFIFTRVSHAFSSFVLNNDKQLQIAFVTGNEMKATEMEMILAKHGATTTKSENDDEISTSMVKLRVLKVDLPEIQGKDTTRRNRYCVVRCMPIEILSPFITL